MNSTDFGDSLSFYGIKANYVKKNMCVFTALLYFKTNNIPISLSCTSCLTLIKKCHTNMQKQQEGIKGELRYFDCFNGAKHQSSPSDHTC